MSEVPSDDACLITFIRDNLTVAAVCDVLDDLGYRHQAMDARLRPLSVDPIRCRLAGRARTAQLMDTDFVFQDDPYGDEITLMDSLEAGDVVVISTDLRGESAPWGELLTHVAQRNGAVGCICDGKIRDTRQILELGFPVFHNGTRPYDSKGRSRVMAYDVPVRCGEVLVTKGDMIFGDCDGVVVIPKAVERDALEGAYQKIHRESITREELKRGNSLRSVFDRYGVL